MSEPSFIDMSTLSNRMESGKEVTVVDVRPEE